jgi:hypothetical protein
VLFCRRLGVRSQRQQNLVLGVVTRTSIGPPNPGQTPTTAQSLASHSFSNLGTPLVVVRFAMCSSMSVQLLAVRLHFPLFIERGGAAAAKKIRTSGGSSPPSTAAAAGLAQPSGSSSLGDKAVCTVHSLWHTIDCLPSLLIPPCNLVAIVACERVQAQMHLVSHCAELPSDVMIVFVQVAQHLSAGICHLFLVLPFAHRARLRLPSPPARRTLPSRPAVICWYRGCGTI